MGGRIGIITMDGEAGQDYAQQIYEALGDSIEIQLYSIARGTADEIHRADLYMLSTSAIESCMEMNLNFPIGVHILDIDVDFTVESVERLRSLPKGTKAMLVNTTEFLVAEAITRLQQLGVHNVDFFPVYPGVSELPQLSLAITPGEAELVPPFVESIIDVGHRRLTPQMMVEIVLELRMHDALESASFQEYIAKFGQGTYFNLQAKLTKSLYIENCFDVFVESMDEGVIGADETGEIFCFSRKAGDILERNSGELIGRNVLEELEFLPFLQCRKHLLPVENAVRKLPSGFVSFSVKPILRGQQFRGIFATLQRFSEAEQKQQEVRMQVLNKGHAAKYRFEDIIGESAAMRKTKDLALRMAKTEFTILIYGESGTGKELFASAIHNASSRGDYPFVAINCAAMPETLLESELFGYEDGAFTGAKKGGKLGLFEFAHRGTLFLDEIENMSPALQVKLLRVLQEREVMRVGGHQTIRVDVRIIAATNESLEERVRGGDFRKDLYYRLATLPIELPKLNRRGGDVLLLFEHFKARYGKEFRLEDEVKRALARHDWDGNVRELQNYVEYFVCLDKAVIRLDDLPKNLLERRQEGNPVTDADAFEAMLSEVAGKKSEQYRFVLSVLHSGYVGRSNVGRGAIVEAAGKRDIYLTEQEVRTILYRLQERGLVCVSRGRSGSRLTCLGKELTDSAFGTECLF